MNEHFLMLPRPRTEPLRLREALSDYKLVVTGKDVKDYDRWSIDSEARDSDLTDAWDGSLLPRRSIKPSLWMAFGALIAGMTYFGYWKRQPWADWILIDGISIMLGGALFLFVAYCVRSMQFEVGLSVDLPTVEDSATLEERQERYAALADERDIRTFKITLSGRMSFMDRARLKYEINRRRNERSRLDSFRRGVAGLVSRFGLSEQTLNYNPRDISLVQLKRNWLEGVRSLFLLVAFVLLIVFGPLLAMFGVLAASVYFWGEPLNTNSIGYMVIGIPVVLWTFGAVLT